MTKIPEENWNYTDAKERLYQLGTHGIHPSNLDLIAKNRHGRADRIADLLDLNERDVLLDLGSGMGFMAEHLASRVHWLHCADVSEVYLEDCRAKVADLPNVETHLIPYADLTKINGKGVSKAYSTLLFIHFNFYDTVYYLQEVHKILNPGGLFFFDFNDGDNFQLDNPEDSFNEHLEDFRDRRAEWIFGCMHMLSGTSLQNLLPQTGFETVAIFPSSSAFTEILVRKIDKKSDTP